MCDGTNRACGACNYDPGGDYSCFVPPAATVACPRDATDVDPTGMNLPQSGASCSLPPCTPCGSSTTPAYRDSSGNPRVGYCVCSRATNGTYSCATAVEWPVPPPPPSATGAGGASGAGRASGAGGAPYVPAGELCTFYLNGEACSTTVPCHRTCGPLMSGNVNCACTAGGWMCPKTCDYDPSHDYSCFTLPATLAVCPERPDNPDPTGMRLPQNGDSCTLPACAPCGSSTVNAYRDSTGVPMVGFCVCSGGATPTYSCARAAEWPPPAAR
jgi:hypothetical protein